MADETDVKVKFTVDTSDLEKGIKDAQRKATSAARNQNQDSGRVDKATKKAQRQQSKEDREAKRREKRERKHNEAVLKQREKLLKANERDHKTSQKNFRLQKAQMGLKKAGGAIGGAFKGVGGAVGSVGRGVGKGVSALGGGAMALGGMALGGVMAGVTAALGMIVGAVTSTMKAADDEYRAFSMAASRNIGHGKVDDNMVKAGRKAGFKAIETASHATQVAAQTGVIGATGTAQMAARTFGGDVGSVAGFMGQLTRGGQGFGGRAGAGGNRVLRQVLQNAVSSGLDRSRTGEFLNSVSSAVKTAGGRIGGNVDASGISARVAAFGRLGAGWQGQRGASALAQIDAGMASGGRDEFSQMRSLQAQGFGSLSGNGLSYYDALKQREQGFFGEGGEQRMSNEVQSLLQANSGNRQAAILQAQQEGIFGNLSISQLEDVFKIGMGEGSQEELAELTRELEEESMDVQERVLNAIESGNSDVLEHMMDFDERNIRQGKEIFESMQKIEEFTRNLIDMFMPLAIDILRMIADAVTAISGFIGPSAGGEREMREIERIGIKLEKLNGPDLTDTQQQHRDMLLDRLKTLQGQLAWGGGISRAIPGFESDAQADERRRGAEALNDFLRAQGLEGVTAETVSTVRQEQATSAAAPTGAGGTEQLRRGWDRLLGYVAQIAGREDPPQARPGGGPTR